MKNEKQYTIGSLFSGIGGIELGFEQAGFKTKWFIECEQFCQKILKKRFPYTKIYGDITKIDWNKVPKVDILTGGFPCQDISNAGKKAGIEGERSSLWKYYCEAIRILQPRIAFIENVSALVDRGLHIVLADITEIGYDAEWYCLPASSVGANHQRERIFIIAYPLQDGFNFNNFQDWKQRKDYMDWKSITKKNNQERLQFISWIKQDGKLRNVSKSVANGKSGYWSNEPKLDRVANGISDRVDRIASLGNAVVPQVAELFAETIKIGGLKKEI